MRSHAGASCSSSAPRTRTLARRPALRLRATPPNASPQSPPPEGGDQPSAGGKVKTGGKQAKAPAGSRGVKTTTSGTAWAAETDALGRDRLQALGAGQDYNINVTHGQSSAFIDSLFTGKTLGHETDIADGSLRGWEFRTFANLVGDYYVAPAFMNALVDHFVKNVIVDQGGFDPQTRVPLILGIWGGKGMGKSFQTELVLQKLGAEAVIMSAGEMEDEWAGVPGKRIRERYRAAADLGRVRGKLTCLVINDLDAGAGAFKDTQRTVNTQMVIATLMAICDDPNHVPGPGDWRQSDEGVIRVERHQRVPILVTGNDLSRLFAPLLRDGRMAKFYWQPTREDLMGILGQLFKDDLSSNGGALSAADLGAFIDAFPGQSLDFFGACKSGLYDDVIREYVAAGAGATVAELAAREDDDALARFIRTLAARAREAEGGDGGAPPFDPPPITLDALLAQGRRLVAEQEAVNRVRLADEYTGVARGSGGGSLVGLQG